MDNINVSIIIPDLSSNGTTRGYVIAKGLQKLGYQVKVFGFMFGEQIYPEPPCNLSITYYQGKKLPALIKTIFDFTSKIDGDILYVIKPQLTSFGVGLVKAWQSKKPMILDLDDWEMAEWGGDDWQYHGKIIPDLFSQEGDLRKAGHPLYLKWLEKGMNRVNTLTVSSKFLEYRYGGTFLPNTIDTDLVNPYLYDEGKKEFKAKYGLSDYKLLMFTGTPKFNQGIEDILTALDRLNNPQLRLILLGGNPLFHSYYQNLLQKWQKWIITINPLPFDSVAAVLSLSDIVLITPHNVLSNVAKCPLEVLEAMAMAKPIIATEVGEIPQILGDTGYLIPPHNPDAIASTISQILDNDDKGREKGELARQRCHINYSMENMTKTLGQVMALVKGI